MLPQFFLAWLLTAVPAAVWALLLSNCLIVTDAFDSGCCDPGFVFVTLTTYQPKVPCTGPSILPTGAANATEFSACSSWPWVTSSSTPPLFLVVASTEYLEATALQLWPEFSAASAWSADDLVVVRTSSRFREAAEPNSDLCAS